MIPTYTYIIPKLQWYLHNETYICVYPCNSTYFSIMKKKYFWFSNFWRPMLLKIGSWWWFLVGSTHGVNPTRNGMIARKDFTCASSIIGRPGHWNTVNFTNKNHRHHHYDHTVMVWFMYPMYPVYQWSPNKPARRIAHNSTAISRSMFNGSGGGVRKSGNFHRREIRVLPIFTSWNHR